MAGNSTRTPPAPGGPQGNPPPAEPPAATSPPRNAKSPGWKQKISDLFPGILFIALGFGILLWARYDLGEVHTVFSFVQIVLGTAVFLFGTGTTGTGSAELGNYRLYVAGGAGVLAFAIGAAMTWQSQQMKDVFRDQTGFARASFDVTWGSIRDENRTLKSVTALTNNEELPTLLKRRRIVVMLPVSLKDRTDGREVQVEFELLTGDAEGNQFSTPIPVTCTLKLNTSTLPLNIAEGVQDYFPLASVEKSSPGFAELSKKYCIDKDSDSLVLALQNPENREVRISASTVDPRNTVNAVVPDVGFVAR
jgi:hypothetical protein